MITKSRGSLKEILRVCSPSISRKGHKAARPASIRLWNRAAKAPQHGVAVEPLDVGILKTLPGTYGGYEGAAVWYAVDRPDQGVGTAAEASLVFSREDHDVVVPADLFKGSTLTAFQALSDHERGALDPEWVGRVMEVGSPESWFKARHDGML